MADASDPPPPSTTVSLSADAGNYVLEVGGSAGMAISARDARGSASLKRAVARSAKEAPPTASKPSPGPVETASQVTDKLEHVTRLITEVSERRLDVKSLSDEADALLDLLQRLDRHERWSDAIRVARKLATLLALLGRWLELLRSLRLALSLAERFGDDDGKAWALHELGTLHLAAGQHFEANRMLSEARETRARTGDARGLKATDGNLLTLCHTLRASIPPPPPPPPPGWIARILSSPPLALAVALSLLLLGGAAGAVIDSSGSSPIPHPIKIDFLPAAPRPGETVAFHAKTATNADPYAWWFGDGRSSLASHPRHVYKHSGTYRVIVTVTDGHGAILGSATRLVVVAKPSPTGKQPPARETSKVTSKEISSPRVSVQAQSPTGEGFVAEQPIAFAARSLLPPGVKIASYQWRFGDDESSEEAAPSHTYSQAGSYTVELLITDSLGATAKAERTILVEPIPEPTSKPTETSKPAPPELG